MFADFGFQTLKLVVKTVNLPLVFTENQHLKVSFQRTK